MDQLWKFGTFRHIQLARLCHMVMSACKGSCECRRDESIHPPIPSIHPFCLSTHLFRVCILPSYTPNLPIQSIYLCILPSIYSIHLPHIYPFMHIPTLSSHLFYSSIHLFILATQCNLSTYPFHAWIHSSYIPNPPIQFT